MINMNEKEDYEMCYMIENRMLWLHLRREEMNWYMLSIVKIGIKQQTKPAWYP